MDPRNKNKPSNQPAPNLGRVRASFRSVLLGWTDEESGDRLTVQLRGSERFLGDLTPLGQMGFELLGTGEWEGERTNQPARRAPTPARSTALRRFPRNASSGGSLPGPGPSVRELENRLNARARLTSPGADLEAPREGPVGRFLGGLPRRG